MPEPNLDVQELSKILVHVTDKLLNHYRDNSEVQELLQLNRPSLDRHRLMRDIFQIGRGTYNPNEVNIHAVITAANELADRACALYNRL